MNQEKIGPFIAKLRKQKNLTQKDLAEKLNITQAAISKWEKGLSFPDLFLIEDLANILEVKISELLNGEKLSDSLPLGEMDKIVTNLLDETNIHVEKQKKIITKLQFSLAFFVIISLCIIAISVIRYYTSPPTFEIIDNYFQENDPYFNFHDQIYTVIVEYKGKVTENDFAQYKELIYEKYKANFSRAEAIYIVYYENHQEKVDINSYKCINVLLPRPKNE